MKTAFVLTFLFLAGVTGANAQGIFKKDKEEDTIYSYMLDSVTITDRSMKNYNYSRYKYIVSKVYPIADTAVYLLGELEKTTEDMKHHDEKKYKKELEDQLREKFEDRLKNMSRTEGSVLIELIERKTGRTMYDILKEVKSGSTAFWWQNLGKFYGYDLKDGYNAAANPLLETIITDYEKQHPKKEINAIIK